MAAEKPRSYRRSCRRSRAVWLGWIRGASRGRELRWLGRRWHQRPGVQPGFRGERERRTTLPGHRQAADHPARGAEACSRAVTRSRRRPTGATPSACSPPSATSTSRSSSSPRPTARRSPACRRSARCARRARRSGSSPTPCARSTMRPPRRSAPGRIAYVAKSSPASVLETAVDAAAEAEDFIDPAARRNGHSITPRQRQILQLTRTASRPRTRRSASGSAPRRSAPTPRPCSRASPPATAPTRSRSASAPP